VVLFSIHSFIHSLLVQLTYNSRTQDSLRYTVHTSKSKNSITVFIKRSCNEVFITQVISLSWQLSVVRASSQMVVLRCCGLDVCLPFLLGPHGSTFGSKGGYLLLVG